MSTLFSFAATVFEADPNKLLQVGFGQGPAGDHYLVIGRLDDQPLQIMPGMEDDKSQRR